MTDQATAPGPDRDPDPLDAITDPTVEDPDPDPVTDPEDPNWVDPASGIRARRKGGQK